MRRTVRLFCALIVASGLVGAALAEPGIVTRKSPLYEADSVDSATIAELPVGTPVVITQRSGMWFEVAVKGTSNKGWLRFSRVKVTANATDVASTQGQSTESSGGGLANLARSATGLFAYGGRQPQEEGVSTIGIRGLQAEDLANARPNPGERSAMEANRASPQQASQYAQAASLTPQQVAYLGESKGGGEGLSLGGFSLSLPKSTDTSQSLSAPKE